MAANLFGRIKNKIWGKELFVFFSINPHFSNTNLKAATLTDLLSVLYTLPRSTDELVQIIVAGNCEVRRGL